MRKNFIIIFTIVLANILYCTVCSKENNISVNAMNINQTNTLKRIDPESYNKVRAISLNKALKIASITAEKWDSKAQLLDLTSVDDTYLNRKEDGHDGNRRAWNFIFMVPGTAKQLILTIHDKKIVNYHPVKAPVINDWYIKSEEINLTSKEAISKCISYFKVIPGQNWAKGYHFRLNKQNNIVVLTVVSLDKEGYFTRTSFNATTKQLICGIHKIPKGGGLFKEGRKIDLNNGKQVSMEGISISPNYANDKSIIAWYFINPYKPNMSLLASITINGGRSWNVLNIKDTFHEILFSTSYSTDNIIYATSPKGLIATNNNGNTWTTIFPSKSYIFNIHTNKQKILVDAEDGLYISVNKGITWSKLNTPSKVVFADFDFNGNLYIYSNNKILKKSNNLWTDMKIPLSPDIIGFKLYKQHLIAYSPNSVKILDMKTYTWKKLGNFSSIKNLFITSNNQIYCLLEDKCLVRFIENEQLNTWHSQKVDINKEGNLVDLKTDAYGKLYFCISSEGVWESYLTTSKLKP